MHYKNILMQYKYEIVITFLKMCIKDTFSAILK